MASGHFRHMRYQYYHKRIIQTLSFLIPPGKRVVVLGVRDGSVFSAISPAKGLGVEVDKKLYRQAQRLYPEFNFHSGNYESFPYSGKYDYIVLFGVLGKSDNICGLLKNLQRACHPSTRLIIYQHNYLWQWFLTWAEKLGLKKIESGENWLSVGDVNSYLKGMGFEVTRVFRRTLFPLFLFGVGPVVNYIASLIPFFDFFKLDQYLLARPLPDLFGKTVRAKSLTVCITVRNERDNIEKIVKSLPIVCREQEILFVEGHSTDGTREEIERVIKLYPQKDVRVIGQPGKGQGDAIRVGFKAAKGEVVVLYEGDSTSDPDDIYYFYDAMRTGRFEFIEGSRFVYPLSSTAMPLANKIGNTLFAKWFSFFLGQRTTDVLSGIKAILKRDYELLYQRWGFLGLQDPFGDFELLYGAARMGLKIGEVPMRYYPREYGTSKTNIVKHGTYLLHMAAKGYWIFRNT